MGGSPRSTKSGSPRVNSARGGGEVITKASLRRARNAKQQLEAEKQARRSKAESKVETRLAQRTEETVKGTTKRTGLPEKLRMMTVQVQEHNLQYRENRSAFGGSPTSEIALSPSKKYIGIKLPPKELRMGAMEEFQRELEEIECLKQILRERYANQVEERQGAVNDNPPDPIASDSLHCDTERVTSPQSEAPTSLKTPKVVELEKSLERELEQTRLERARWEIERKRKAEELRHQERQLRLQEEELALRTEVLLAQSPSPRRRSPQHVSCLSPEKAPDSPRASTCASSVQERPKEPQPPEQVNQDAKSDDDDNNAGMQEDKHEELQSEQQVFAEEEEVVISGQKQSPVDKMPAEEKRTTGQSRELKEDPILIANEERRETKSARSDVDTTRAFGNDYLSTETPSSQVMALKPSSRESRSARRRLDGDTAEEGGGTITGTGSQKERVKRTRGGDEERSKETDNSGELEKRRQDLEHRVLSETLLEARAETTSRRKSRFRDGDVSVEASSKPMSLLEELHASILSDVKSSTTQVASINVISSESPRIIAAASPATLASPAPTILSESLQSPKPVEVDEEVQYLHDFEDDLQPAKEVPAKSFQSQNKGLAADLSEKSSDSVPLALDIDEVTEIKTIDVDSRPGAHKEKAVNKQLTKALHDDSDEDSDDGLAGLLELSRKTKEAEEAPATSLREDSNADTVERLGHVSPPVRKPDPSPPGSRWAPTSSPRFSASKSSPVAEKLRPETPSPTLAYDDDDFEDLDEIPL